MQARRFRRHRLLQTVFWNPVGARVVGKVIRYESLFDTIVRNYSLISDTNGERWLVHLTEREPLLVDVGCYDGSSTDQFLRIRPKAHVIGFDPSHFAATHYVQAFLGDPRVRFEPLGLADKPGVREFYDYDNMCNSLLPRKEMTASGRSYSVTVTTLDEYCSEHRIDRIDLVKIDAEGFDLNVLEGAERLLSQQAIDVFAFEFASGWASSRRYLWEAVDYFQSLPYALFHLFDGFLSPLIYDVRIDSCCTLPAMYVGVSDRRMAQGDVPLRSYRF